MLIGADGIHSAVRGSYYPREGEARFCGQMMWRAAVKRAAGLDRDFVNSRPALLPGLASRAEKP